MRQTEGFFCSLSERGEARIWRLASRCPPQNTKQGPGHLNMQCGTEAEIKERRRQTERWVWWGVGGWVEGETERGRNGKVRKGGGLVLSFLLIRASHHHLCSCVTPLTLRKIDSLITTPYKISAHDRALMCFCSGAGWCWGFAPRFFFFLFFFL